MLSKRERKHRTLYHKRFRCITEFPVWWKDEKVSKNKMHLFPSTAKTRTASQSHKETHFKIQKNRSTFQSQLVKPTNNDGTADVLFFHYCSKWLFSFSLRAEVFTPILDFPLVPLLKVEGAIISGTIPVFTPILFFPWYRSWRSKVALPVSFFSAKLSYPFSLHDWLDNDNDDE